MRSWAPRMRHYADLVTRLMDRCDMHLFLSNCNKTPRKLEVYASVFRGVSFCLGAEKLMLCTFKMYIIYTPICTLFITIFVQERERGRFNRARDRASRTPGRVRESVEGAMAEYGGARGSAGGAHRALGELHEALS
jgi:hypothetical protein